MTVVLKHGDDVPPPKLLITLIITSGWIDLYINHITYCLLLSSHNIPIIKIPLSKMTLISWRSIVQNSYQSSLILIACVRHHKDLDTLKQTDEDLPVDAGFISHCNSLRTERDFPGPGGAFGWPSTLASAARRLVQQLRFSQHWHEIPLNMIYDIPLNIKWYIMGFTFSWYIT